MKKFLLAAAVLMLGGCSTYPPGVDPKGQKLQVQGDAVLDAIVKYMDDTNRPPKTLQDLVPKYLAKLPDQPQINYDFNTGILSFDYDQEGGANPLSVECHTAIGQTSWVCD